MAKSGGKKKKSKELLRGLQVLIAVAVVVLLVAVSLPSPVNTGEENLPEPTLPPPPANPYGPEDFVYENGYLKCTAGTSVLGIDVSSYQGQVDWQQVKEAGVEFVMIRVGYRGYKTPKIHEDPYAQTNYEGAKAAGLKVGAYFFSQAVHKFEAKTEAEFMLRAVADWELDLPLVYDWEYVSEEARTGNMDARTVTDCTLMFCRVIEQAGYEPMVYFNTHQARKHLYLPELTDYPFWLAMYTDQMTYDYKVTMWQYTNQGKVPGIAGDVDLNLWFPENE